MTGTKFQDPPPARRGGRVSMYGSVAADLRANPQRWALVFEARSPSIATQIKAGKFPDFPPNEFEATGRRRSDGKYDTYVRFIGEVAR